MSVTIDYDALLKEIGTSRKAIQTMIHNARRGGKSGKKAVKNEGEDEVMVDDFTDDGADDIPDVGETVVIEPTEPIVGSVVEIVEEDDPMLEIEEEFEEEPVSNATRYRRVKNARIIKNADGSQDVVVPVETKKVENARKPGNVRRYTRRVVANGQAVANRGTSTKYQPVVSSKDYATILNKAKKYDELLLRNSLDQEIDRAIGDAMKKYTMNASECDGIQDGTDKTEKPKSTKVKNKYLRFKNYRMVENADGTVDIIADANDSSNDIGLEGGASAGTGADIYAPYAEIDAGTTVDAPAPTERTAPTYDEVPGEFPVEPATLQNTRARSTQAQNTQAHNTRVKNVVGGKVVSTTNYQAGVPVHNAMTPQELFQPYQYPPYPHPHSQQQIMQQQMLQQMLQQQQPMQQMQQMDGTVPVYNDASALEIPSTYVPKQKTE